VPIELVLVEWLCGKLGLPDGSGGVLTSGGSLGNLTALLAMRQAHAGFDARHRMTPEAVAAAVRDARSRGMHVIGIVAAAGSTATGAFDPLAELADLA